MPKLNKKTALITGASRGIGAAIARQFSAEGANVVLFARNETAITKIAQDIEQQGGQALTIAGDISRYEDIHGAVQQAINKFGQLDILINNAGVIEPIAWLTDSDPAEWAKVADINYKGVYFGLRAALPYLQAQQSGIVLNMSSGAASNALEGWSHYCSSKAAVLSLTKCAHRELSAQGVRVLGLSPGTVATDMQVAIKESGINAVSQLDPAVHISPEWVAKAAVWLCTEDAKDIAGEDFALRDEANRRKVGLIS